MCATKLKTPSTSHDQDTLVVEPGSTNEHFLRKEKDMTVSRDKEQDLERLYNRVAQLERERVENEDVGQLSKQLISKPIMSYLKKARVSPNI